MLEVGTVGSIKTEDLNTHVFNMITGINESKTLKRTIDFNTKKKKRITSWTDNFLQKHISSIFALTKSSTPSKLAQSFLKIYLFFVLNWFMVTVYICKYVCIYVCIHLRSCQQEWNESFVDLRASMPVFFWNAVIGPKIPRILCFFLKWCNLKYQI